MQAKPVVSINDAPYAGPIETSMVDGKTAFVIPLPAAPK
jgi:hypothetical protein